MEPLIKELKKQAKSQSQIIKEDCQKRILKNWLKMLKNSKMKMSKLKRKLNPKTLLKITLIQLETH